MTKTILLALAFGLMTTQAFAKPSAKEEQTLTTAAPNWGSLQGLSAVVAYDFADTAKPDRGNEIDTEKSFAIGAQYEFSQFYPGIGWQVGGLYELSKESDNGDGTKSKYKNLTGSIELVGKVTPKIKIVGGINYTSPDLSNAPGSKLKGDMGFQAGATYLATNNFAVDVRYRSLRMELTQSGFDQFGTPVSVKTDVKSDGLMFAGRYMF